MGGTHLQQQQCRERREREAKRLSSQAK